jgi:hypothetical protein
MRDPCRALPAAAAAGGAEVRLNGERTTFPPTERERTKENPMHASIRTVTNLSALALLAALAACGDDQHGDQPSHATPPAKAAAGAAGLPAGLVTTGPADGPGVAAAKATAKQGQPITLVGRIGGSRRPFVEGRAVFTIVDPAVKSCSDLGDADHCETPWDYCCEPRENLKRHIATIEIDGADGKALPVAVKGVAGLDPLATVAVTGTVTEANDAGLLVVRATHIEVKPAK